MQNDEQDKKLFQVGEVMVTSVEEICQCGFTSSSLISTSNSSFACHPDDPTVVQYQGLIYGISVDNNDQVVDAFHEWAASNASIQIYGDTLYVGCVVSTTPSMTPVASSSPSPVDSSGNNNEIVAVAVTLAVIVAIGFPIGVGCCLVVAYTSWRLGMRRNRPNTVNPVSDEPPPSYACVQARLV